jgi:antitoxin component of RelBE/YafQ-DinJ toxin-antitoxin module
MTEPMKRNGRPPKQATTKATLTLKIDAELKNLVISLADGYDMTITEYIRTLVERDASQS